MMNNMRVSWILRTVGHVDEGCLRICSAGEGTPDFVAFNHVK